MKLPLYLDDKKPIEKISINSQHAINEFNENIEQGNYKYIENRCLCGSTNKNLDVTISEKDRYGITVKFLLRQKCSIIRTDKKLDESSLSDFYTKHYRKIYGEDLASIENEFNNQTRNGGWYKTFLKQHIDLHNIKTIFDFGCGTGGVLNAFKDGEKQLFGSDYNEDRLNYGRSKQLNLYHADKDIDNINAIKYDLVILSHVMEHFANPVIEINNLFDMITDEGYILIVVPSPLNIGHCPQKTSRFFQNVHLYNFNKDYLVGFFAKLGMEVIYIDEVCQCILRKPKNWIRNDIDSYNDIKLENKYEDILKHFKKVVLWNDIFKINILISSIKNNIINILKFLHLKKIIKQLLKR
jgi:2-polyprenyl-3-methyl-5-hydroxy-6-metoxy-1,4-benzoquinol methylase